MSLYSATRNKVLRFKYSVLSIQSKGGSMRILFQDLRFSYREWSKRPGLALTAILSLALGIGATTAVFSVIYALLVNPYPYRAADRMVHLIALNEKGKDW